MVDRKRRLDCANGIRKADIVLKHGKVLNVFTEEILEADVAICGDTIVGVGSYEGEREIDCTGKYLVPGFLDAHMHGLFSEMCGQGAGTYFLHDSVLCSGNRCGDKRMRGVSGVRYDEVCG